MLSGQKLVCLASAGAFLLLALRLLRRALAPIEVLVQAVAAAGVVALAIAAALVLLATAVVSGR